MINQDDQKLLNAIMKRIKIEDNGCWIWQGSVRKSGKCVINHKNIHTVHSTLSRLLLGINLHPKVVKECSTERCVNPKHYHIMTELERFTEKIMKQIDGCWNWIGALTPDGYGEFWSGRGRVKAHRMSYELFIGNVLDGLFVCHHCDNPSCVNPDHLFLGTQSDNMQDMYSKNRQPAPVMLCGERNPTSKLKSKDIMKIRNLYSTGEYKYKDLAKMYNISISHIGAIVTKNRWKHL